MTKLFLIIALAALLALLPGCTPAAPAVYDIRLMALDDLTEDYIHYISHRRLRLSGGEMGVETTFVNRHPTDIVAVDWRLIFYDRDGFQIEESEWNTEVFPPRQEVIVKGSSIRTDAVDFMLQIRGSDT